MPDRVLDVLFDAPGGIPLRADLYLPTGLDAPAPVIVWVHGGGWRFGDRTLGPDLSRYFAQAGFAMASVDYRSSEHALFPAQIEDLKTAIRWLRSVAPTYGLDAERIGLWGSSSGGHLAALAATSGPGFFESPEAPYQPHTSSVRAVVVGYGVTDFLKMHEQRDQLGGVSDDPESQQIPPAMRTGPASLESMLFGRPVSDCPDRARTASPLTYAKAGAPPFLIVHGLSDTTVPPEQSELLYEALAFHDNDVTLLLAAGLGHGFLNRTHLDDGPARFATRRTRKPGGIEAIERAPRPVFATIEEFFRQHLRSAEP